MMKITKRNLIIVALVTLANIVGTLTTNIIIAKKSGYKYNKETHQFEKMCYFGIDLDTEDKINKANLVWNIIAIISGLVARKFLDK